MRSSSERINIAASAQRLDVDHRISLRYYFRIADNVLRQADIFRGEKNVIDLYVMLLRFSSLVSETIPCHRDYRTASQNQKLNLKKKLLSALTELEQLQPSVQQKLNELDRKRHSQNHTLEWPSVKSTNATNYDVMKVVRSRAPEYSYRTSQIQQLSYAKPVEQQFRRMSLNFPPPKEETLSKHSILGPSGLIGQWQPPRLDIKVQYPSNIDLTPVQIPSAQQRINNELQLKNDINHPEQEASSVVSNHIPDDDSQNSQKQDTDEPRPMISFEDVENPVDVNIARDPSPPPVLAEVLDLAPATSPQVSDTDCRVDNSAPNALDCSESPLELHISTTMMESFMKLAKSNTDKNLETCGVLAGTLKNRKFFISALIIPKQESTSDSCQTTNEEEIFEVQDKRSLFPLGWIHTHPTQSCFMSSIDLHTHYSYQIMLPESVAIVMAPKDSSRRHGIFRLTSPGGMSVIRQCQQRGFHPHDQPPDGGPIYKTCTDVYMNPSLKFETIDLR